MKKFSENTRNISVKWGSECVMPLKRVNDVKAVWNMPFFHRGRDGARIEPRFLIPIIATLALVLSPIFSQARDKARANDPDAFWSNRVEPLLDKQCLKCHAGVRQRGGLDLRSLDTILRGGDRGPAIIPGKPNESRIVQFALAGSDTHMPPDNNRQLSAEDISVLKTWIAQLPPPKSPLASGTSTNNAWVPEYLADYRRSRQTQEIPPAKLSASAAIDWFLRRVA